MKHVLSRQAAAIVSYLESNGYSKNRPFIPLFKITITLSIELPLKYVYDYLYKVYSVWVEDGDLFVSCRPSWPGSSRKRGKRETQRIIDYKFEPQDYEDDSFGTDLGAETYYWNLSNMMGI